jgi:hypothetical protein
MKSRVNYPLERDMVALWFTYASFERVIHKSDMSTYERDDDSFISQSLSSVHGIPNSPFSLQEPRRRREAGNPNLTQFHPKVSQLNQDFQPQLLFLFQWLRNIGLPVGTPSTNTHARPSTLILGLNSKGFKMQLIIYQKQKYQRRSFQMP